ncbi:MAG: exo-alpha-sialidase [Bacteroidetes bacterium]|nr:exo-alpha-sialidase [Bacteroidota bacterium]MBS1633161.1 exo-alpha-sialidase [Bacteroidota bacterium]
MKNFLTVFVLASIIFSCTNNESRKPGVVKEFSSPAGDSSAEPNLFTAPDGQVYLTWIEKKGKESSLKFSTLNGDKWSDPGTVASGNNWMVNWADYPGMASDGNNLISHFLEKGTSGNLAYDIKYVTSSDKGKSWSNSAILHDDGKQAEHGFVSMIPYGDKFFACWLDGRNAAMEEGAGHEGHYGQMTIRAAIISKEGIKENEWELDGKVCDCCQTTAAMTSNGPIVVYRDRSDDEIRDMSMVRFVNGEWTKPKTIFPDNWKINACPVNGPRADAVGNNLAIAWFSLADNKGEVKVAFSGNGGETFGKPFRVDEGKTIGRVDIVMLDSATAMVTWLEGADIKARKVHADGKIDNSILIASSSEKRASGFPQMTKTGKKLIFAWTDDEAKTIKVAEMDL